MILFTCRGPERQGSRELLGLALLVLLAGCAAQPSSTRPQWYQQHHVEFDFEAPPPQQVEEFRRRGITLPRVSSSTADPKTHRDFIDLRVTAVGFGLTDGGYLLYCEGLALPVLVPEAHVNLTLTRARPPDASLYPDRDTAMEALEDDAPEDSGPSYAYYRGAGGTLIVPTVFSPATTPRIARTMLEVRQHLSESTQRELKVLLVSLAGTQVLRGLFSRVVGVSARPAVETHAPRQPVTNSARPAPAPAPAPAQDTLAPSPVLVQALTGRNPTPAVAPGTRLPQDVTVSPKTPGVRSKDRPVGSSPTQNAQLRADIKYVESMGADNIRVNQQQLKHGDRPRVGINRPDLQFDYEGRRYHVEYDTPASGRGTGHQSRITSNDPDAEVILLIVP
ncbi:MAG TPA: hypothetical protein VF815_17735 [Myxococcaceae bacterium]|jgi:hypothetical protein